MIATVFTATAGITGFNMEISALLPLSLSTDTAVLALVPASKPWPLF